MLEENKQNEILHQLKDLPKPVLKVEKQVQMLTEIQSAEINHAKRERWQNKVTKLYVGLATVAAIFLFSFLTFQQVGEDQPESNAERGVITEYEDHPNLSEHQVALHDLYVEMPFQKADVELTKRTTDEFVMIDIIDKETEEVLYTYGEGLNEGNERLVFREIKTEKTIVRLYAFVEMDEESHKIIKVRNEYASYDPQPPRIAGETISSGSRSGKFPAEKIEILASLDLDWGNEIQNLYEGYLIGVIEK
ncbi:hypothetical protein SAMN05192533_101397 [Mesobacillus persicus]|uniref:Uncharacterized protein n=1 Tax=Mesobacillus persicus TaxID=930146 RepID=A0A1H7WF49_9BACI|nr:hypothetical protein [Mesobacillus persicus]SEM20196.1 hypothetical protein SAMN05192533_101397 [Mesobacillus persicus]